MDDISTNDKTKPKSWWTPAKKATILCFFLAMSCAMALWTYFLKEPKQFEKVWSLYDNSLRGSVFSGFLSTAGFLLALHTFIIVKMREEVYDTEEYRKMITTGNRYQPLRNLSGLLFSAITLSFAAAIGQLTLGLMPIPLVFCLLLAIVLTATIVFGLTLYHVRENMKKWMDVLDKREEQ